MFRNLKHLWEALVLTLTVAAEEEKRCEALDGGWSVTIIDSDNEAGNEMGSAYRNLNILGD